MSLQLATKGRISGALPNATRGVIYVFGAIVPVVLTVIPDLIFRRASITTAFKRISVDKIFRREDV